MNNTDLIKSVTNELIWNLQCCDDECRVCFTNEAIGYIRDLFKPLLTTLNEINNSSELYSLAKELPEVIKYKEKFNDITR